MCGVFGILTKSAEHNADDFITNAFMTSMVRGVDSSGIVNVDLNRESWLLHKLPVAGNHFITDNVTKRYTKYATAAGQITMGHVRAATVGAVSISNAHPFVIEGDKADLVGMHNGTLTGWATKPGGNKYSVDSEWALSQIEEKGISAFEEFTGAYAFVWWRNDDKDTLYMARNSERPLAVVFLKSGGMAWASEPGMLYWLLERNTILMDGPVITLEAGQQYSFPVDKPKEFTKQKLPVKSFFSSTNRSNYTPRTYNTTIQDVDALIAKAKEATAAPEEPLFPVVFEAEVSKAKDYGWYDKEAEFSPVMVDEAGNTIGIAEVEGVEFDAMLRGDYTGKYSFNTIWRCRVLGLQDNGRDLNMVMSLPSKEIAYEADIPGDD